MHLSNQPMGTEETKLSCYLGGMTAIDVLVLADAVEALSKIPVSDAMNAEFGGTDRSKKVEVIFTKGIESTDTLAFEAGVLTKRLR